MLRCEVQQMHDGVQSLMFDACVCLKCGSSLTCLFQLPESLRWTLEASRFVQQVARVATGTCFEVQCVQLERGTCYTNGCLWPNVHWRKCHCLSCYASCRHAQFQMCPQIWQDLAHLVRQMACSFKGTRWTSATQWLKCRSSRLFLQVGCKLLVHVGPQDASATDPTRRAIVNFVNRQRKRTQATEAS